MGVSEGAHLRLTQKCWSVQDNVNDPGTHFNGLIKPKGVHDLKEGIKFSF